jgi:hypothetical protein
LPAGGTDERTTEFAAATLPHQSKDQSQRGIDLPHLSVGQVTRDLPESLRIHGGCLFDKHSSPSAQQFHLGRKHAASADVEVGATSQVDNARK